MARMKLTVADPLPHAKEKAIALVNEFYAKEAANNSQRDVEHQIKRDIARSIINNFSYEPPQEFIAEAELMNLSAVDLANVIVQKPDEILRRGLRRRADVLAIRNATTAWEIDAIERKYRG